MPLDGPARTVAALADWLKNPANMLAMPLGSLEILASPSPSEAALPALAGCTAATTDAVVAALQSWRARATTDPDDYALFYFAGHGLQRSRNDAVMLLQDFNAGRTLLENSVSLVELTGGMGSTIGFPNAAGTQFYFADCCRSIVPALRGFETAQTAPVFSPDADVAAVRSCPIFLAANGGWETFTQPGGLTYFGKDLLDCLAGAGADKISIGGDPSDWVITAQTLSKAMSQLAAEYNRQLPAYKRSSVSILAGDDPVLCRLKAPPQVRCTIKPAPAFKEVCLRDPRQIFKGPAFAGLDQLRLQAGVYYLSGTLSAPSPSGADLPEVIEVVMPPTYVRNYQPG